jgi:hypothetical protein
MSFIVRHKITGRYLQGHGEWTNQPASALQFNSGLKLVDYLERGGVREKSDQLEIVVVAERPMQSSGHSAA